MLRNFRPRLVIPLLLTIAFLTPTQTVRAQFDYPRSPVNTIAIEKMKKGELSYASDIKKHEELIGELAKWFAHRLVHPPFNGMEPTKKKGGIPEDIETLMSDTERYLTWTYAKQIPNEMQLEYAKAFGKALEYEVMEVYEKAEKKLEKVNAARMLSLIGKMPYEPIVDTYLKIIRDAKYPPEIKLFAFQGLRNFLAIPNPTNANRHVITNAQKLAEVAGELEKYITHQCSPGLTQDEALVIQFIRREAVRALAQFKFGVIRTQPNQPALDKPIWTLLRIATNDKIVKPADAALPKYGFHILERIEAIIGICSMFPDKDVNYDLVVYLINDALIEIGKFQQRERDDFIKDPRNKPLVPWRIVGVRLTDALKQWKTAIAAGNFHYKAEVNDWVDKAMELKCIPRLELDLDKANFDYRAFEVWQRDKKPKSTQVIAEDDTTTVVMK